MAEKTITWYNKLKEDINGQIKQNGRREITGAKLNSVLNKMVDALGKNMTFGGVVSPATVIDNTDDNPVFYLALVAGNYPYCGNIVVGQGQIAILFRDANNIWYQASWNASDKNFTEEEKKKLQGLPTEEQLRKALDAKANAPESKPGSDNLASFDEDGNLKDSGLLIPVPGIEEKNHILALGENGLRWVPKPADGDDAYGVYVNEYKDGHGGSTDGMLTRPQWLASLKGEKGNNAVNPFKGWHEGRSSLLEKFGNPLVGDYAYVDEDGVTHVYRCVNDGVWPDSSNEEKEPSTANFASQESVNAVSIDKSHLTNSPNDDTNHPAVAKVSDVMQLKAKQQGLTMTETKVQISDDDLFTGYVQTYNDSAGANYIDSIPKVTNLTGSNKYAIINVSGHKSVRFLGRYVKSSSKAMTGWAFYDGTNYDSEQEVFLNDRTGLISYRSYDINSEDVEKVKEYVVEIPEGAVYLKVCVKIQQVTPSNFYCYLQDGYAAASSDSVNELDKKTFGAIVRHTENFDESNLVTNSSNYFAFTFNAGSVAKSLNFSVHEYIKSSYCRELKNSGKKLLITKRGSYTCWITFLKHDPPASRVTLQELVDSGCLSSVHNFNGGVNAVIAIYGEQEIEIPEDCLYIHFTKFTSSDSQSQVNHLPDNIQIVSYERASDGLSAEVEQLAEDYNNTKKDVTDTYDEVFGELGELSINGYEYDKTSIVRGMSIDSTMLYNDQPTSQPYRVLAINLEGCEKIIITPQATRSVILMITKEFVPRGRFTPAQMWGTYCDQECYNNNDLGGSSEQYRVFIRPAGTEGAQVSGTTEIILTQNSKWIYMQQFYKTGDKDYSPEAITIIKYTRSNGLVELKDKIENSSNIASSPVIGFLKGYYNGSGAFVKTNAYVTTTLIPMGKGCLLTLFSDSFRIYQAFLFDSNGNMVNPREMYANNQAWGSCFSSPYLATVLPQFYVRYKIGSPQGDHGVIGETDRIIKELCWLDNPRIRRKIPTNTEMRAWASENNIELPEDYDIEGAFPKVAIRTNTLLNVLWSPVRDGRCMMTPGESGSGENYVKRGDLIHGIPYSEASEFTKYVGQHVSLRTWLTAVQNPRSVVYTEDISSTGTGEHSKYGIEYAGLSHNYCGPYYGTVCSGYTSYAQGRENIRMTSNFTSADTIVNLLTLYSNVDYGTALNKYPELRDGSDIFDKIQPLDLMWYSGHAMLVTDVYVDEFGRNKYVVITEQTIPYTRSTVYTRESFKNRYTKVVTPKSEGGSGREKWTIYRYKYWTNNLYESTGTEYYEKDDKLVQQYFDEYSPKETPRVEDEDIQCFAGDYAAFAIGDPSETLNNNKMYLNIHRGGDSGYNYLQIFAEDETDMSQFVDELSLTDESLVTESNILAEDGEEDWIKFNIALYWYNSQPDNAGKFKARIVRKLNGQIVTTEDDEEYVSGFVHFEMVYMGNSTETKLSGTSQNYTCYFKTSGVPYLVRQEKKDGMTPGGDFADSYAIITDNDYSYNESEGKYDGSISCPWNKNATSDSGANRGAYKYIKLFVRGEYGVVVKRILLPDVSS